MSLRPALRPARGVLAALVLLALAAGASAHESSRVLLRLDDVSNGRAPHARAMVDVRLEADHAVLRLRAWRLPADGAFELRADDVAFASFTADRRGRARVVVDLFDVPLDPRGRLLSVADAQGDLLAGVVSGPMEPRLTHVREKTELQATGSGRALVRFHRSFFGVQRLTVRTLHAPPGLYEVLLDGEPFGHLLTHRHGYGRADFVGAPLRSRGHGRLFRRSRLQPLTEDPRYRLLELVRDGEVLFAGPVKAQIPGLDTAPAPAPEPPPCTPGVVETAMDASSGEGILRHGYDDACRERLEIEVSFLRPYDYTVSVNGSPWGPLAVAGDGTGGVVFAQEPAVGELALPAPLGSGDVVEVGAPELDLVIMTHTLP